MLLKLYTFWEIVVIVIMLVIMLQAGKWIDTSIKYRQCYFRYTDVTRPMYIRLCSTVSDVDQPVRKYQGMNTLLMFALYFTDIVFRR